MDWVAANDWHAESLRLAQSLNDTFGVSPCITPAVLLWLVSGETTNGRVTWRRGSGKRREVAESWGLALVLVDLEQVLLDTHDSTQPDNRHDA
jgi:hypothetical protein